MGLFDTREQAEKAVRELQTKGFRKEEISIVARQQQGGQAGGRGDQEAAGEDFLGGENISGGAAWGGTLGGLAGLLAGVGALAIPGIGPVVAAGPLAATLGGAVTGGVAGSLLDLGIPENEGRQIEQEVKRGRILCAVETRDKNIDEAARILRTHGARDVKLH